MLLEDVLKLAKRLIETDAKHQDYQRTTDLAKDYRIFITGKGIDGKLIQYVRREDAAAFAQRVRITKAITPAVASSIRQPFNKVVRNDRIRKGVKMPTPEQTTVLENMVTTFYGSSRKKTKGLDYFLKTRFLEMQFIDPNSWIVAEWQTPESEAEQVQVHPFEVSSTEAVNFFIVNDEVKWLMVKQDITYLSAGQETATNSIHLNPASNTNNPTKNNGTRWTLYESDFTIVFEQIDPAYLKSSGYVLGPKESQEVLKEKHYLVRVYEPKIGYVPAFRIGYKRDEETNGRTYVNPWHDALCYFEKSLKTVSELDLTMTLHAFPQKIQYVQKCNGSPGTQDTPRRGCNQGHVAGMPDQICGECKGLGYKVHTSAQDAILVPMPDDTTDMVSLENILVYKTPPIELIKFQNEYVIQLERQAHQAVFNSQVFGKKAGGGMTESTTATEADFNMESVYDALEPFTEKASEFWKEMATIMGIIAGAPMDKIEVVHEFPADYKLKTGNILLAERKVAKESGAPIYFIDAIDEDLAVITFAGDKMAVQKYKTKKRFFPFAGMSEEDVAVALSSEMVLEEDKILHLNFEIIFRKIEKDNKTFYFMKEAEQDRIVTEAVTAHKALLDAQKPKTPSLGFFRPMKTEEDPEEIDELDEEKEVV